jgi:ribosomal protein L40E
MTEKSKYKGTSMFCPDCHALLDSQKKKCRKCEPEAFPIPVPEKKK